MLRLGRILVAGTAYAVTVLMVGTVLGVVRVLMLEPRFGALEATMLELPLLLGLAGQVAFASLPLVQLCLFERRARALP